MMHSRSFVIEQGDTLTHIIQYVYSESTAQPGALPARFQPVIPDLVASLGVAQVLLSALLIFLFLLAVRNRFRIK